MIGGDSLPRLGHTVRRRLSQKRRDNMANSSHGPSALFSCVPGGAWEFFRYVFCVG